jgi:hypothetical protein
MPFRLLCLAALVAGLAVGARAQTPAGVVLSGTVTDVATGEALIGATVATTDLRHGTATNAYGHFSLPLPAGPTRLVVSYVGYARRALDLDLAASQRLDVALDPDAALGEVVVDGGEAAGQRPERTPQMGRVALTGRDVRGLPALLGEADVLKVVQLLPGVRSGQEGTAGLYVRGGSPDQTLILLDGTPVYNPSHLFGFLSTFNGDAVNQVELTKGAYPARFGGRLGSVLDVRLRDGDLERHHVQGQVGILSGRLLVEGPLAPGRASFLVSGRRTYVNLLARPFVDRANREAAASGDAQVDPRVSFYDLNAKVNWRPSARDRLYLSLYGGGDAFAFQADPVEACDAVAGCAPTGTENVYGGGLDWGNLIGSLRYTRVLSPRAFAALTLTASDYAFDVAVDVEEGRGGPEVKTARARYRSGIRDLGARLDLDVAAGRGHALRAGGGATLHRFTPGALSLAGAAAAEGAAIDTLLGASRSTGLDAVLYAEDEWRVGRRLALGLGLHAALYVSGAHRYPSLEPRLSAAFQLRERLAVKASAAVTQQPIHLLTTGTGTGLPADLWVPADSIGPQRGWQAALGLAGSSASGRTTWTLEGYWREMRGLVSYRDGASFTTAFEDWQELVVTGAGRAAGVEAFIQHRTDRLTAWVGYTLAKTDRRFDALDGGAAFPFRYDRRHDVSAVALLRLSRRFDVSAVLVYGTGDAVTLPAAVYDATYLASGSVDYWIRTYAEADEEVAYGPRNRYRLPAYARVDLGATLYFRRGPRPHALALNVYNATNRKNPFVTTLDARFDEAAGESRQQLVGIALFPVLPTLSYQFAF